MRLILLLLLLLGSTAGVLHAHQPGQSYLFMRVYGDSIHVRLEISAADLNRALHSRWAPNGRASRETIREHLDAILAYVGPRLRLAADGRTLPLRFTGHDLRHIEIADYVLLHFAVDDPPDRLDRLEVAFPVIFDVDPSHRNFLVQEYNWRLGTLYNPTIPSLVFTPSEPVQTLDLSSSSRLRGFVSLVRLGLWHIWIGIDHVLFLIALILPAVLIRRGTRWEPVAGFRPALMNVLAIVTCFTVAHSITLSLAALGVARLPSRPVEAMIAASIGAAALYNLYPRFRVPVWGIAFGFGLFHGFGFANVLGAMGLERDFMALSLLGFNVGVELGQMAIICAVFPVLFLLRTRPAFGPILRYGSAMLIVMACIWFVERAFQLPVSQLARGAPRFLYRLLIAIV